MARRRSTSQRCAFPATGAGARAVRLTIAVALLAVPPLAAAQVYKCTDATGRTTYADAPCDRGAKPLKLPEDVRKNPSDPNMCAQLLDETRRLAAEAERNKARGRTESAASAKRRHALTNQYETRCAGVSRSVTGTK
jgi:hypothetical protein